MSLLSYSGRTRSKEPPPRGPPLRGAPPRAPPPRPAGPPERAPPRGAPPRGPPKERGLDVPRTGEGAAVWFGVFCCVVVSVIKNYIKLELETAFTCAFSKGANASCVNKSATIKDNTRDSFCLCTFCKCFTSEACALGLGLTLYAHIRTCDKCCALRIINNLRVDVVE